MVDEAKRILVLSLKEERIVFMHPPIPLSQGGHILLRLEGCVLCFSAEGGVSECFMLGEDRPLKLQRRIKEFGNG